MKWESCKMVLSAFRSSWASPGSHKAHPARAVCVCWSEEWHQHWGLSATKQKQTASYSWPPLPWITFFGEPFSVSSSVLTQWLCQHPLLVSQREKHFEYLFNVGLLELPNQQQQGAQKMKPLMIPEVWEPSLWPPNLTDRWNCFHKALHVPLRGEGLSQPLQAAAWSWFLLQALVPLILPLGRWHCSLGTSETKEQWHPGNLSVPFQLQLQLT